MLAGPLADPGHARHLAAYERARRPDVLTRTAAVDALNRTLLSAFLPVQALRGFGLFMLDRLPALRRAVMRQGVAAADQAGSHPDSTSASAMMIVATEAKAPSRIAVAARLA